MNTRKISGIVILALIAIFGLFAFTSAFYHQNANEICVVQSAVSGTLTVSSDPGMHSLWGGHVTRYPRRGQIDFDNKPGAPEGALHIPQIEVRFNDGAEAKMSGSLAWEMPVAINDIITLHKNYGSATAIEQQIIVKNLGKAIYMTGPLMSSAESYASRRNDLLSLVYDQVEHGAYKTVSKDVTTKDPLTGQDKTIREVDIVMNGSIPVREDTSLISMSGLHTFNLTLEGLEYPSNVEQQIQNQQQSIMAVQTAIAKAKTAEQDAITIEQQGKATAAQSKWEQEAIKAKEVTISEKNVMTAALDATAKLTNTIILAQMRLQEAELDAKAAEQTKAAAILRGQGAAEAAKLVMSANGALEQKLAAWEAVNKSYADAIAAYKGNWVPTTVFGGQGGTSASSTAGGGASDLIQLLTAKTARDISLDLGMSGNTAPKN